MICEKRHSQSLQNHPLDRNIKKPKWFNLNIVTQTISDCFKKCECACFLLIVSRMRFRSFQNKNTYHEIFCGRLN